MAITLGIGIYLGTRGVRALRISPQGITLESSFGSSTLRLAWSDIASAERSRGNAKRKGATWTFVTQKGKRLEWRQAGLAGDQRLELEKELISALQRHGVYIKGGLP